MSLDSSLNASDLSLEITSEPSNESADWMGSSVENSEEIRESADSFRKTSFFTRLDLFLLETHVRDWTRTAEIRAVSLIGYLLRAKFENRKRILRSYVISVQCFGSNLLRVSNNNIA